MSIEALEVRDKSFGNICYLFYCEKKRLSLPWENLTEEEKEVWNYVGDKIVQYYDAFILEEFLGIQTKRNETN